MGEVAPHGHLWGAQRDRGRLARARPLVAGAHGRTALRFGESPGPLAIVGGAIVLAAITLRGVLSR
jgi:hypothetical protein